MFLDPDIETRHRGVFVALLALIAWLPVPLGSNRPWSWSLMEAVAFVLVGVWLLGITRRSDPLPAGLLAATRIIWILLAWICYVLAQSLPAPTVILEIVNPAGLRHYQALDAAGIETNPAFSVARQATLEAFLKYAAYVAHLRADPRGCELPLASSLPPRG